MANLEVNDAKASSPRRQSPLPQQGYEYEFVPHLDPKYECPICLQCLREPAQTTCGHRFCQACILTWLRNKGQRCPEDNSPLSEQDVFADNFAKREILALRAKCPNSKHGCMVILELSHLEVHIRSCNFKHVECPNNCTALLLLEDVKDHITNECLYRVIECSLCNAMFPLSEQQSHFLTCPMLTASCELCGQGVVQRELIRHLEQDCPSATIACLFENVGCKQQMKRKSLANHLKDSLGIHLELVAQAQAKTSMMVQRIQACGISDNPQNGADGLNTLSSPSGVMCDLFQRTVHLEQRNRELELQVALLVQQIEKMGLHLARAESLAANGRYLWNVTQAGRLLTTSITPNANIIHSPGFYTGSPGYKACLRLNLTSRDGNSFLSLFLHLMKGEFDDLLYWPFSGTITLAVLDQSGAESGDRSSARAHIVETMTTKPNLAAFQRPTSERNPKGFGYTEFLALETLLGGGYIKDDVLTVYVVVIPTHSIACARSSQSTPPVLPSFSPS